MKVYLAGKISKNDWRHEVVKGLRNAGDYSERNDEDETEWPILEDAIAKGVHYTGPIPTTCDHGCYHGENSHGVGATKTRTCAMYDFNPSQTRANVFNKCEQAIKQSSLFLAWIDTNDCYGTLVEIGMAQSLNKIIIIGSDKRFDDMWFAYQAAHYTIIQPWYDPATFVHDAITLARKNFKV